jgi:hypothetical protein
VIKDIRIRAVLNGFVVKVACQEVVFDDVDKLLAELELYLLHPGETELHYMRDSLNAKHSPNFSGPPVDADGGVATFAGLREAVRTINESSGPVRASE